MNISSTKRHKSIIRLGDFNALTGNVDDILENSNKDYSEELNTVHCMETANAATQRSSTNTVTNFVFSMYMYI